MINGNVIHAYLGYNIIAIQQQFIGIASVSEKGPGNFTKTSYSKFLGK
jgi:hypothetical protein